MRGEILISVQTLPVDSLPRFSEHAGVAPVPITDSGQPSEVVREGDPKTPDVFTCNFFTCNLLKFFSGRMSSGAVKQGYHWRQLGKVLNLAKDRDNSGCMSSDPVKQGSQQLDQARKLAKDRENVISPREMEGVWYRIYM
jgi:hypothetical protein